eukprot:scaffold30086_cov49-Phaeocystis_antarctica.AAC.5
MLDTPGRGYRAVGPAEGIAPSRRTGGTCGLVQCASLSLLILSGVAMLVTRPQSWPALPGYSPHSGNATLMHRGKRYGKRRAFMSLGRMGTSSSFVNNFMLRSRRPKKFKAQKVAAAQSAAAPAPHAACKLPVHYHLACTGKGRDQVGRAGRLSTLTLTLTLTLTTNPDPDPNPNPSPSPSPHPNPEPNPSPHPDPNPNPDPNPSPHPNPDPSPHPSPRQRAARDCLPRPLRPAAPGAAVRPRRRDAQA